MYARVAPVVLALLFASTAQAVETQEDIASNQTSLSESAYGQKVEVTISSAIVRSSEAIPNISPGQYPENTRSIRDIKLSFNGSVIFVPRSSFADLLWATKVRLSVLKRGGILFISGGDASESYTAKIVFTRKAIQSRQVFSNESPSHPTERTEYFQRVSN